MANDPTQDTQVRVLIQKFHGFLQGTGFPAHVVIREGDIRCMSVGDGDIARCPANIAAATDQHHSGKASTDGGCRAVGRTIINNNNGPIFPQALQATERLQELSLTVACQYDNGASFEWFHRHATRNDNVLTTARRVPPTERLTIRPCRPEPRILPAGCTTF